VQREGYDEARPLTEFTLKDRRQSPSAIDTSHEYLSIGFGFYFAFLNYLMILIKSNFKLPSIPFFTLCK